MNTNPARPSVIDCLLKVEDSTANSRSEPSRKPKASSAKYQRHKARPLELPRDRLALTFQKCRQVRGLSIAGLAEVSGIDVAHIWRIEQGERPNTSRETLIVLCMAMVLDSALLDQVIEVANEILDAAGLKMLRSNWQVNQESKAVLSPIAYHGQGNGG